MSAPISTNRWYQQREVPNTVEGTGRWRSSAVGGGIYHQRELSANQVAQLDRGSPGRLGSHSASAGVAEWIQDRRVDAESGLGRGSGIRGHGEGDAGTSRWRKRGSKPIIPKRHTRVELADLDPQRGAAANNGGGAAGHRGSCSHGVDRNHREQKNPAELRRLCIGCWERLKTPRSIELFVGAARDSDANIRDACLDRAEAVPGQKQTVWFQACTPDNKLVNQARPVWRCSKSGWPDRWWHSYRTQIPAPACGWCRPDESGLAAARRWQRHFWRRGR